MNEHFELMQSGAIVLVCGWGGQASEHELELEVASIQMNEDEVRFVVVANINYISFCIKN